MIAAVLCGVTLYLVYRFTRSAKKNDDVEVRRYPPGPTGLPLLGSLLDLRSSVMMKMKKYAEDYGSIYSLKLGPSRLVVLNTKDAMKEAFVTKAADLSHRPQVMMDILKQTRGIILSQPGTLHHKGRNFLSTGFRIIKLGVPEFSYHIHPHIDSFKDKLRASKGQPVAMCSTCHHLLFEIFTDMMLGEVPDPNSERVSKLLDVLYKALTPNPMMVLLGNFAPQWLKSMLSDWIDMSDSLAQVTFYLREHIQKHREAFDGNTKNLIDAFLYREKYELEKLNKLKEERNGGSGEDSDPEYERCTKAISTMVNDLEENEKNLTGILLDVFQAGCTSVVAALQWVLLDVALHQDVQEKIRMEIDQAVEQKNKRPSLLIRSNNFPFTKAVMLESLRLHPPAPLGAPHCAARNTKLGGYDIDKGTIVLANIFVALQDAKQWENAGDFWPERFLKADGTLGTKESVGFSIGPRMCPGKLLSNTVVGSILTEILLDFTLHLPPDHNCNVAGSPGIIYNPQPFSVIAKPRTN